MADPWMIESLRLTLVRYQIWLDLLRKLDAQPEPQEPTDMELRLAADELEQLDD